MENEDTLQAASGSLVKEDGTFVEPGSSSLPNVEKLKDNDESLEQEKSDTAPGPVHSALGLHDPSNASVKNEGEVELVVNESTDPKRDGNADSAAGWPVISEKKKS